MYLSDDTIEFKLYHATNRANAAQILKNGFKWKRNDKHWLGQGVYFYKYKKHAEDWTKKTRYISNEPTILEVCIEVLEKSYFDLDNPEYMEIFINYLKETFLPYVKQLKRNFDNFFKLICAAIDYLTDEIKEIYLISYNFSRIPFQRIFKFEFGDNKQVYEYQVNELQFCVTQSGLLNHIIKNKQELQEYKIELEGIDEYV